MKIKPFPSGNVAVRFGLVRFHCQLPGPENPPRTKNYKLFGKLISFTSTLHVVERYRRGASTFSVMLPDRATSSHLSKGRYLGLGTFIIRDPFAAILARRRPPQTRHYAVSNVPLLRAAHLQHQTQNQIRPRGQM